VRELETLLLRRSSAHTSVPRTRLTTDILFTMKFAGLLALAALAQSVSAHYIWNTLIAGSTTSTAAVRQPVNNSPVTSPTASNYICNTNTAASATVSVAAGSTIGFKVCFNALGLCLPYLSGLQLDNTVYHLGPAAIYLGKGMLIE
jgi:hypothetical protein